MLQLRLEFLPRYIAGTVVVRRHEELSHCVQQEPFVFALRAFQSALDENACHDVHQRENAETHIGANGEGPPRRQVPHQRARDVVPIDAAGDHLEEHQHRVRHASPMRQQGLEALLLRLPQHIHRDDLRHCDGADVDDHEEEAHGPHQGPEGAEDRGHDRAQLVDALQRTQHAQDAGEPQDPPHPKNPHVEADVLAAPGV
mmetsp:Transcript_14253/g.40527  ORF Transcript_14253/g.40527 Transcript_14253/m.40527 type:complete len:200 (+) Transcript_14253:346-945(+)